MTFLQAEAPLRLKFDGFRKALRLRSLHRKGALETFAVEGQISQAVRFFPAGAVSDSGGRLTAIPEATETYATALEAFEALGRRLQAAAPRAALRIEAVTRAPSGCFWLQEAPGVTLETWLADHPARVAEPVVAAFARSLAGALGELHAAGIVHGDLSPRAVLVDGDQVRLTGFMVDRRPFFRALRSQQDLVQPGYAPPEAHDGALRHPIGPTADLYAASALLQRLLTGRTPPAANLATRVADDSGWPGDITVSSALRAGIDAGLAPTAEARPASAATWLAGLDLGPEPEISAWFDGLAKTLPAAPPREPEPLTVPAMPVAEPSAAAPSAHTTADGETPLTLAREARPRRHLWPWVIGGGVLVATAIAAAALAPSLLHPKASTRADASKIATPVAPTGCQWITAAGGWRLLCTNTPSQGLALPERFDAQTTARAMAGEPAAMERLGAFYRQRAGETANPDRGAYAYQALDWLQRAAGAVEDGRPDTARARDDAALALGQMLAHGEGGRAPDPSAAEARLRQAAADSRADAVLALAQFLETHAGGDADRLAEARGLYGRVAQLGDGSALQQEGEHGLARIPAPKPAPAEPPPQPKSPVEKHARKPVEEEVAEKPTPARKPKANPVVAKPPPKIATRPPLPRAVEPKPAPPLVRAPPKATVAPAPRRPVTPPPAPAPRIPLRTWTASAFVQVDPTTNFSAAIEAAGRAACANEGGETLSVRSGDTLCPNGVNYCQVRAVATCQGARP